MTPQKAIEILTDLKKKLETVNIRTCEPWKSSLISNIVAFFGENSAEHDFSKKHGFYYSAGYSDATNVSLGRDGFNVFIDECITNIKNRGLKKKEWKHLFITTNPAVFFSILIALLGFAFFLGQLTANNKAQNINPAPVTNGVAPIIKHQDSVIKLDTISKK